jgi:hypothetical protein
MQTINVRDINHAAIFAGDIYPHYESHIKTDLSPGFGIEFANFGHLALFLVSLGADATYTDHDRNSMRTDYTTPDDARMLAADLQVDPLGHSIVAYFPGWELDNA